MDKTQRIAEIIKQEQAGGLNASAAESLRWAAWLCWEEFGSSFDTDREPHGMTSREFADGAELVGVARNTATNRYSEARRNWEKSFA